MSLTMKAKATAARKTPTTPRSYQRLVVGLFLVLAAIASSPEAAPIKLSGPAFVGDDGTIRVDGKRLQLYAIILAPTDRDCRTFVRPARCASRSVLVLEGLIDGFVECTIIGSFRRNPANAVCTVAGRRLFDDRIDIGARLIEEGFAFAAPGGPVIYQKLEDVARNREVGVWGNNSILIR